MINKENIEAYACINKKINIRKHSSSGGCFYELAKYIIENDGVVFAARFDDDFHIIHDYFFEEKDILKFMGSKYAPSKLKSTFKIIKDYLDNGKLVMFTGTPCQNNGLSNYLKKEYSNLVMVDFICHGVPDERVWEKYLQVLRKRGDIKSIQFRNKDNGWKDFRFKVEYHNGCVFSQDHHQNIYMQGFLSDLDLNSSCYNCRNKGYNRTSDFTMADLWGIDNIASHLDDNQGISAFFVNTKKGKDIFNQINNGLIYEKIDMDIITKYNMSYYKSVNRHKNNKYFMERLDKTKDIERLIKHCLKDKLLKRILRKVKNILRSIMHIYVSLRE